MEGARRRAPGSRPPCCSPSVGRWGGAMALADFGSKPVPPVDPRAAIEAIPRNYNFAADILERNLAAGRAGKAAFIDPRGSWTYGQLAERVDRFGRVLRS